MDTLKHSIDDSIDDDSIGDDSIGDDSIGGDSIKNHVGYSYKFL